MIKIVLVGMLVSVSLLASTENMIPSFSDFDENRDGKISKGEFDVAKENRMKKQFEAGRMTKNIDSKPSFEGMDTNKDKFVDVQEFSEYRSIHREKIRGK